MKKNYGETEKIVSRFGFSLLDEYIKNKIQRVVVEDKNRYRYDIDLLGIINKRDIRFVDKKSRFSLKNISLWLVNNNKTFELCDCNIFMGTHKKLKFHCFVCDNDFLLTWGHTISGIGCGVCAGLQIGKNNSLGYLRPDLIEEWSEKNTLTPFNVALFSNKKVWWKCKLCGNIWESKISTRINGKGCSFCWGRLRNENRLSLLYPDICCEWNIIKNKNLTPSDVSYGSGKKVWWLCSVCGFEWKATITNRVFKKSRCPNCATSMGNEKVAKFLYKKNIALSPEYRYADCKYIRVLPFDFYLPYYNTCIEYDGEFHYENRFNNLKEFENVKKRDTIKTKYCQDNNIQLIRIPYWNYNNIETILSEKLNI